MAPDFSEPCSFKMEMVMLNLSELSDVLETPGLRGASCGIGPWGPGRRPEEVLRCISQLKACLSYCAPHSLPGLLPCPFCCLPCAALYLLLSKPRLLLCEESLSSNPSQIILTLSVASVSFWKYRVRHRLHLSWVLASDWAHCLK